MNFMNDRKARIAELEAERDQLLAQEAASLKAMVEARVTVLVDGLDYEGMKLALTALKAHMSRRHAYEYDDDE